jgi:NTE family protein
VAFVLAGGGNLGAIQAGMLRALSERRIRPDLVVGCSVGAMNGAAFATDPTLAGARLLEARWRNVEADQIMPPGRLPGAVQLIRKGESIHPNRGVRELIIEFLGGRTQFGDLKVRFECVATDMAASQERWFSSGPLVEPLLASAALPAVFPPVDVEGRRYLDGGVVNNVPLSRAIQLGAERIYVLHVGSHGRPQTSVRRPVEAALIGYWIARNSRFSNDLAEVPAGVQVVVLCPEVRPDLRYDDFSATDELIGRGYDAAVSVLDSEDFAALANPQPRWMRALGLARPGSVIGTTDPFVVDGDAAPSDPNSAADRASEDASAGGRPLGGRPPSPVSAPADLSDAERSIASDPRMLDDLT